MRHQPPHHHTPSLRTDHHTHLPVAPVELAGLVARQEAKQVVQLALLAVWRKTRQVERALLVLLLLGLLLLHGHGRLERHRARGGAKGSERGRGVDARVHAEGLPRAHAGQRARLLGVRRIGVIHWDGLLPMVLLLGGQALRERGDRPPGARRWAPTGAIARSAGACCCGSPCDEVFWGGDVESTGCSVFLSAAMCDYEVLEGTVCEEKVIRTEISAAVLPRRRPIAASKPPQRCEHVHTHQTNSAPFTHIEPHSSI